MMPRRKKRHITVLCLLIVGLMHSQLLASPMNVRAKAILQVCLHLMQPNPIPGPGGGESKYKCEECQDTGFVGDQRVPCPFCVQGQQVKEEAETQATVSVLGAFPGYTQKAYNGPSLVIVTGEFCPPCLVLKQQLKRYTGAFHICVVDSGTKEGKAFLKQGVNPDRPFVPQGFLIIKGKVEYRFGADAKKIIQFLESLKGAPSVDAAILKFLDGERKKVIKAVIEEGSQRKAADKLGKAQSTVAEHVRRAKDEAERRGYAPEYDRNHPVPKTEFISGVSTHYGPEGEVLTQWVKTKASHQDFAERMEMFVQGLVENIEPAKPVPVPKLDFQSDVALHLKIGDQHLGLCVYPNDASDTGYGVEQATSDLIGGAMYLIENSPPCERCVIVNVGDFFHANDRRNVTPAHGNALDVGGSQGAIARRGSHLLKTIVDLALSKHKTVEIINARGNHDPDAAVWLGIVLDAYYADEPRVKVYDSDDKWIVWEFDKTAVFVNHGEKKPVDQYLYISNVYRDIFGTREHIYIDNGHIHHKQVHEIGAARLEVWNPLTEADAYHTDNCYSAERSITSVLYHRQYGEVGRNRCGLRMIRDMYA